MYIKSFKITNIKTIQSFRFELSSKEKMPGWHVIIGDNGSGKTTLARAVALALVGPREALALKLKMDWGDWIRIGSESGEIQLAIKRDKDLDLLKGRGQPLKNYSVPAALTLSLVEDRDGKTVRIEAQTFEGIDNDRYIWGGGRGWFSASYGPFRRFSGGNFQYEKLYYSNPRLAPHLSVFGEDAALSECLGWLTELYIENLELPSDRQNCLGLVIRFINEGGLLPHNTVLKEVTRKEVHFVDGNGCTLNVDALSDGYRSVLSMTFELVRQLVRTYGQEAVFRNIRQGDMTIDLPGVVIIDEVDAHLHPSWQRRIGGWFTKIFPKLQFIVTTHSPLICQTAANGSVWRLSAPGERTEGKRIVGAALERLVYGTVLEAFETDLFGKGVSRSALAQEKLSRLAALNVKQLRGKKLSSDEKSELNRLRATFPSLLDEGLPKQ